MKFIFGDQINRRFWSVDINQTDENYVSAFWDKPDPLFSKISNKLFDGIETWADLELNHFNVVLYASFDLLNSFDGTLDDITIRFREPFATFKFVAGALCKYLKSTGNTGFDTLIITRTEDDKVVIRTEKTYVFSFNDKPGPRIQLVIDNTK